MNAVERFFNQPDIYLRGRAGINLRAHILKEALGMPVNCTILDIGCGDGSLSLPFLSESNIVTMMDISQNMLDIARQNTPPEFAKQTTYIKGDFLEYTPNQTFDIVLCIGVLAHVESTEKAVKKLAQLTSPQGICIVQFSNAAHWLTKAQLLYHAILDKISARYQYKLNQIEERTFCKSAYENHQMRVIKRYRYFSHIPGMGRIPQKTAQSILFNAFKVSKSLPMGTEILLLMKHAQKP